MERNAEYGIVAAYRFVRRGPGAHSARGRHEGGRGRDEGARASAGPESEHLEWLRRLVEWQRAAVDPVRFLESLRCDLAEGQVHVFVDGNRLLLPANSTPVDVAYAISPEIGDRCVAATVNGQLAFLSSPLADGDVVEIHTARPDAQADSEPIGPSPEWLSFVRTPHAQLSIEARLGPRAVEDPELAPPVPATARVRIGRAAIGLELRRRERTLANDMPLLALAGELGYHDVETLLLAVADHREAAAAIADRLIEQVDNAAIDPLPEATVSAEATAGSGPATRP
jgi:GTP pyrophosphokinase